MRILVVGASGRVGRELVAQLLTQGHEVLAGTRHVDEDFGAATVVDFDVLADEPDMIAHLRQLAPDAIYFVAGSRGQNLLQVDAFGAVKLENAAEELGIKRFIMLSSWNATQPEEWGVGMRDYNIAKFFADRWLMDHTDLDWTILQPSQLIDEPDTDRVTFDAVEAGVNNIPDVAAVLAALLKAPNAIKRVIRMRDGNERIIDAVADLKSV